MMLPAIGVTEWTVPWKNEELCCKAEQLGLSLLHLDLGSAAKGYPLTDPAIRDAWLKNTARHQLKIISLALNDLGENGFTAGMGDARSEIAVQTMKNGVETAHAMGIPSISVPHFFANRIKDEVSFSATVEALRSLCDQAAEYGILINTENVLDNQGLEQLWNEVDKPNLRLMFDTQNYSAMAQMDAVDIFLKWKDVCSDYIHLKDGDTPALGNRMLGKGTSGFADIFSVILRSGYTGGMILESNYQNGEELLTDAELVRSIMANKGEHFFNV